MNRPNLRLLPTPALPSSPVTPVDETLRAEADLAVAFEGLLVRGERDEESPEYEQLEAAVDGTLDPVEAELFASRLAGDPLLQREFDELVALRDRLKVVPAARRVAPAASAAFSAFSSRRWLGFAAAAMLLIAASVGLRLDLGRTAPLPAGSADVAAADRMSTAQRPAEPLFADSFEGGTTDSWSN